MHTPRRLWRSVMWLTVLWLTASGALAAERGHCGRQAGPQCLHSFALPAGAGQMHYYASRAPRPGDPHGPQTALLILHGHPRDVGRSFEAGLQAARAAGRLPRTLVVAPLYQVAPAQAGRCSMPDTPGAQPGDALWSCAGWLAGAPSLGAHPLGAFAALDALLGELARQWPSLRSVTLVGFSAGAQMLQHSIGFAADPPAGVALRYVIADPGSWLYFDPVRPVPLRGERTVPWEACGTGGCTWRFDVPATSPACAYDHWKYGTQSLPGYLRVPARRPAHTMRRPRSITWKVPSTAVPTRVRSTRFSTNPARPCCRGLSDCSEGWRMPPMNRPCSSRARPGAWSSCQVARMTWPVYWAPMQRGPCCSRRRPERAAAPRQVRKIIQDQPIFFRLCQPLRALRLEQGDDRLFPRQYRACGFGGVRQQNKNHKVGGARE